MYTTKRGTSTQKRRFDTLYVVTALARCLGLGHRKSQFVVGVVRLRLGVHPSLFVGFLRRKVIVTFLRLLRRSSFLLVRCHVVLPLELNTAVLSFLLLENQNSFSTYLFSFLTRKTQYLDAKLWKRLHLPLPKTSLSTMSTSAKPFFKVTCLKRKVLKATCSSHLLQAIVRMQNLSIASEHRYKVPAPAVGHDTQPCQLLWSSKASKQSASKILCGATTIQTETRSWWAVT